MVVVALSGCAKKPLSYQVDLPREWTDDQDNEVTLDQVGSLTQRRGVLITDPAGTDVPLGTKITVSFPTPCGRKKVTFDSIKPERTEFQGETILKWKLPKRIVPIETRVFVAPSFKGLVKIGEVTSTGKSSFTVWDIACVKTMTIDGVETPIPSLAPSPRYDPEGIVLGDVPDEGLLVTGNRSDCFIDAAHVYGKRKDGTSEAPREDRLTGANAYALAGGEYRYVFTPAPPSAIVGGDGTTTVRGIDLCRN